MFYVSFTRVPFQNFSFVALVGISGKICFCSFKIKKAFFN